MQRYRKWLAGVAIVLFSMLLASCGGGSSSTTTHAYVGTQTAGDFWTWSSTTNGSTGTFTSTDSTTGYTYSGTSAALSGNSTGFTKLTLTSSNDTSATVGSKSYQVEIPGTALISMPGPFQELPNGDGILYYGSNSPPVIAVAQGSCPTSGGTFNWIMVPPQTWCSGADTRSGASCPSGTSTGPAYGTATITVSGSSYGMTVQPYLLDGTTKSSFTMSGATCSNGVISGTDSKSRSLNISFTPSGLFFIDLPSGDGSIVGADASTNVPWSDLLTSGTRFIGTAFMSIKHFTADGTYVTSDYDAPDTRAGYLTADGSTLNGKFFLDLDSGTLQTDTEMQGTFTFVSEDSPGMIKYSLLDSKGTQTGVFVVKKISGKYYLLGLTDHWTASAGSNTGEMTGRNLFMVQTQ